MEKILIGRVEYASLPELGFYDIDAKIDTGAYTSSIHCDEIQLNEDGTVHFRLLDPSHPDYHDKHIVMPVSKLKNVKSSNGTVEERIFVKTKITLCGKTYKAELSLTDRSDMKYPMLIGRKFLNKHYIVDVSMKYQNCQGNT
ncbi:MAG: RimK/LysX family protein [Sulfurimonadaceae bacterium]|nr:RimK/LysX family protein [Sulfurimonadaceae bacterium]